MSSSRFERTRRCPGASRADSACGYAKVTCARTSHRRSSPDSAPRSILRHEIQSFERLIFALFDAHGHRVNVVFKQIDSLALYACQVADANGVLRLRPGESRTRSRKKYRSTCSILPGARWPTRGGRNVSDLVRSRASGMETSGLGL